MISERSANRGSCAQSCRKDYVLTDLDVGRGARPRLPHLGEGSRGDRSPRRASRTPGIGCLKVEGRKKKPEYVATVTNGYRDLPRPRSPRAIARRRRPTEVEPLVQIYSRGFTRRHVRRPRGSRLHHARRIPTIVAASWARSSAGRAGELIVEVSAPLARRRRRSASSRPPSAAARPIGFSVTEVRTLSSGDRVPAGARHAATTARRRRLARGAHCGSRAARARARELRRAARRAATAEDAPRRARVRLGRRPLKAVVRRRRRDGDRALRDQPRARVASARSTSARCASSSVVSARRRSCSATLEHRRARARTVPAGQRAQSPAPAGRRRAAPAPRLGAPGDARGAPTPRSTRRSPRPAHCARLAGARARRRSGVRPRRAGVHARGRARRRRGRRDGDRARPVPPPSDATASRACVRSPSELAAQGVTLRLRTPTIVRPEERRTRAEVARPRAARS